MSYRSRQPSGISHPIRSFNLVWMHRETCDDRIGTCDRRSECGGKNRTALFDPVEASGMQRGALSARRKGDLPQNREWGMVEDRRNV